MDRLKSMHNRARKGKSDTNKFRGLERFIFLRTGLSFTCVTHVICNPPLAWILNKGNNFKLNWKVLRVQSYSEPDAFSYFLTFEHPFWPHHPTFEDHFSYNFDAFETKKVSNFFGSCRHWEFSLSCLSNIDPEFLWSFIRPAKSRSFFLASFLNNCPRKQKQQWKILQMSHSWKDHI